MEHLPEFDEFIVEVNCPSIYRRYELSSTAKNDLVYVQDDDCLIGVKELFEYYNGQLTNAINPHHLEAYKGTGITLVGFGTFFPKSMVNFTKYLDKYEVDDLFLSQTDRIFTYLNQPHNSIVLPIHHLPRATEYGRMSTTPGHYENLRMIHKRLLDLDKSVQ